MLILHTFSQSLEIFGRDSVPPRGNVIYEGIPVYKPSLFMIQLYMKFCFHIL